jgi:(p)ppGpp synthase/HD superfamily hydrolase
MELTDRAREFALAAHGEQKYGQEPYSVHLDDVAATLSQFGFDDPILRAAAYLHDVVEDTTVTLDDLRKLFPEEVVYIVDGVTSQPGPNRKTRNAATYPRIAEDDRRLIVKLADRIANVRTSLRGNPMIHNHTLSLDGSLYQMYLKEYPAFRAALHSSVVQTEEMWDELDKLMRWSST